MKVSRVFLHLTEGGKKRHFHAPFKTDANFKVFGDTKADEFYLNKGMELAQQRFGDKSVSDKELQGLMMEALNRP